MQPAATPQLRHMWSGSSGKKSQASTEANAVRVVSATLLAAAAAGAAVILTASAPQRSQPGTEANLSSLLFDVGVPTPPASFDNRDMALEALVAPVSLQCFYEQHYQSRWLHTTAPPGRAGALRRLWSARDAEMWLENARDELKLGEDVDVTLDGRTYFKDQMREPSWPRLFQAYADDGGTLTLNLKRHPQFFALKGRLSEELGAAIGVSSHLTAARHMAASAVVGLHGADLHHNGFDALVLQTVGSERWTVCERSWPLGPQSLPRSDAAAATLDCRDVTLTEGDTLYLPTGTYHQTLPVDGVPSVHVTLSLGSGDEQQDWAGTLAVALYRAGSRSRSAAQMACVAAAVRASRTDDEIRLYVTRLLRLHGMQALRRGPLGEQALRRSLSNEDLPAGAIGMWSERLRSVIGWATRALAARPALSGGFATPHAQQCRGAIADQLSQLERLGHSEMESLTRAVLSDLRNELAAERLSAPTSRLTDGGAALRLDSKVMRSPSSVVVLSELEGGARGTLVLTTRGATERIDDPLWRKAIRWAASEHAIGTAQGRAFAVRDLPVGDAGLKLDVVRYLRTIGVLQGAE